MKPKAGDLALVKTTDDVLIEKGSYGVIDFVKGDYCEITFNPMTPFRLDSKHMSTSGGPVRRVSLSRLRYTGKKKITTEWNWGSYVGAGGGVTYKRKVNVFEVYLE